MERVVVLGAGYAGAGAVTRIEAASDDAVEMTWVSDVDHHLVRHEVHRVVRDADAASTVAIPIEEIKSPSTTFRQGRVTGVDPAERTVVLADGECVAFDYLLVALGSRSAFYGIEGLETHARTLDRLTSVGAIHDDLASAAAAATPDDPARIVVGGAGLSGVQVAGEVAAYRDEHGAPVEPVLVEGLDTVLPAYDPDLRAAVRVRLADADVPVRCGSFVSEVDDGTVFLGGEEGPPTALDYDLLVWTGGITGGTALADSGVDTDGRTDRVYADRNFRTSDDRVFAIGDAALVDQGLDAFAPPTAQAAWQAASVAGENLLRAARGESLRSWTYDDRGTLVSVGERAVAHGVDPLPVDTFGGPAARFLKKFVAARWIASVSSVRRALRSWSDL